MVHFVLLVDNNMEHTDCVCNIHTVTVYPQSYNIVYTLYGI